MKHLLMKLKEGRANAGLPFNMNTKVMTAKEITSLKVDNKDIDIVKDFAHLSSVISSHWDCSQEINRRLRLRRTAMG